MNERREKEIPKNEQTKEGVKEEKEEKNIATNKSLNEGRKLNSQ